MYWYHWKHVILNFPHFRCHSSFLIGQNFHSMHILVLKKLQSLPSTLYHKFNTKNQTWWKTSESLCFNYQYTFNIFHVSFVTPNGQWNGLTGMLRGGISVSLFSFKLADYTAECSASWATDYWKVMAYMAECVALSAGRVTEPRNKIIE